MAHKNIDISGAHIGVSPNNRMISHFNGRIGTISLLIYTGKNLYVRPWAFIVGIPLFPLNGEIFRDVLHYRVVRVFVINLTAGKRWNIIFESYASHKIRKPGPHGISIEFA